MVQRTPGEEMAAAISVTAWDDGYVGQAPDWFGGHLFGGVVVGQAVHAATQGTPDGRRIHSLHGYFERPGDVASPIHYDVEVVRGGRSFEQRQVLARQGERVIFRMLCSFTADTGGYDYQLSADDVPPPENDGMAAPGPWSAIRVGPSEPNPDGTRRSTSRAWLRCSGSLPDDPAIHAGVLGLLSDFTFTGGRPLHLDGDVRGLVSLDHAVWFHRPVRADEWLLYDVHSLVNAGGRGLLRGVFYTADGALVASVAQEMRIWEYPPD